MKTIEIPYDEFLKLYEGKITVCRLYPQIPPSKIIKFVRIQKNQPETMEDFDRLEYLKLVWYQNASGKSVGWDDVDARHLELKNKKDEEAYRPEDREKIREFIKDFKTNGLTKNVEIISATDLKINEEIIIDGVHRAVALYRLYQNEPNIIEQLLSSKYGIYLINFRSPAAALFFPWDFLGFMDKKSTN